MEMLCLPVCHTRPSHHCVTVSSKCKHLSCTPDACPICQSVCVCVGRLVGQLVRKVYCGKTAKWIRMLFGMVSGAGQGMGVLDGGRDVKGEGQFWGEFGVSHCNQCGLCYIVVWKCMNQLSRHLGW